jgi:hypothetical protein
LVIIDPTIESQIGRDFYHGVAHEWSPYFGYPLHGLPILGARKCCDGKWHVGRRAIARPLPPATLFMK